MEVTDILIQFYVKSLKSEYKYEVNGNGKYLTVEEISRDKKFEELSKLTIKENPVKKRQKWYRIFPNPILGHLTNDIILKFHKHHMGTRHMGLYTEVKPFTQFEKFASICDEINMKYEVSNED